VHSLRSEPKFLENRSRGLKIPCWLQTCATGSRQTIGVAQVYVVMTQKERNDRQELHRLRQAQLRLVQRLIQNPHGIRFKPSARRAEFSDQHVTGSVQHLLFAE
jgi:hypothetical protein